MKSDRVSKHDKIDTGIWKGICGGVASFLANQSSRKDPTDQ